MFPSRSFKGNTVFEGDIGYLQNTLLKVNRWYLQYVFFEGSTDVTFKKRYIVIRTTVLEIGENNPTVICSQSGLFDGLSRLQGESQAML